MKRVLAMILAGGRGERLDILTQVRAKPAVPFGGKYRLIDFSLSNCVNSGVYNVAVLTQYLPRSLHDHIGIGKPWDLDRQGAGVRLLQPYQGRKGSDWYKGTADAIYHNLYYVVEHNVELVLVLSGDHIYKMDYMDMVNYHESTGADLTVAVTEVPAGETQRFGMITADSRGLVTAFVEKPKHHSSNLGSMGVYLFNKKTLIECLEQDAQGGNSVHDFGHSILPTIMQKEKVFAYLFGGYWRDVGTVQSYWEANMDLLRTPPLFNLYDSKWVIHTKSEERAPAFISNTAEVLSSLISHGCTIEGRVENSVLSPGVRVEKGALVKDSIVMFDSVVEEDSVVSQCILDKGVSVGQGSRIGFSEGDLSLGLAASRARNPITLVGKTARIPPGAMVGCSCRIFPDVTEEDFPGLVVKSGESVGLRATPPLSRVYRVY